MASLLSLQEENRILQQELSRVEDLLAQSRAERDELAIKYNAISERLEQSLRLEAGDQEAAESRSLAQHNIELRRLLDEEQAAYNASCRRTRKASSGKHSWCRSCKPRCCSTRRNVVRWSSSC